MPHVPEVRVKLLSLLEKLTVAAMRSVVRKFTSLRSAAASITRSSSLNVDCRLIVTCPPVLPMLPPTLAISVPATMFASSMVAEVSVTGFNSPALKP